MKSPARLAFLLVLALSTSACAAPHDFRDRDQVQAMEAVVRAQEAAWNRGDLDDYMSEGYERSADLTFFSGGDVTHGYQPVLERYRQRYKSEGKEMGRLAFSDLETLTYGRDVGVIRGRWRLDYLDGSQTGGLFTLILRRTSEGWRIVHDHTSVGKNA